MAFTPEQLHMQPPGSVLDWRIYDDGFIADPYRIVLMGPKAWRVTRDDHHVGTYRSLKLAFSSAEHHFRESVRRGRMVRYGGMAFGAAVALLMVDVLFHITGAPVLALALFPIVWVGVAAFVRFIASTPGNLHNPYRPRPWRRRNRW